jgi:hypothetical protein
MQIWDLFEDKHLFYGNDPDGSGYKTRAHLAEVVGLLGPPPLDLLKRGSRSKEFFDEEGTNTHSSSVLFSKLIVLTSRELDSWYPNTKGHKFKELGGEPDRRGQRRVLKICKKHAAVEA